MPDEFVSTFGRTLITALAARPNRQLELVEFEAMQDPGGTVLFYLDQAAAATHAEQVNRALREVAGGQLVATTIHDRYRLVADDEDGRTEKLGFAVDDPDVQRRSLRSLVDRRAGHRNPRIQVQTVIEHEWRDFEFAPEKTAA